MKSRRRSAVPMVELLDISIFFGNMNTCITIRTIVLHGNDAYIQAGAGIVADSVPEREYEETLNKAKRITESDRTSGKIACVEDDK